MSEAAGVAKGVVGRRAHRSPAADSGVGGDGLAAPPRGPAAAPPTIPPPTIRVLIADDHSIFRLGLRRVLQAAPDMVVVAEAGSGEEALAAARACEADVAVVDVSMPGRGGLETARHLKASHPRMKVLMLTVHPEERYALEALRQGADGYLTKDALPGGVVRAVRKVASGGKYVSSALAERLAADAAAGSDRPGDETLSSREVAVMRELAAGRSAREVAAQLNLSPTTVRTCRARILRRLRLATHADLVLYALRAGRER